MCGRYVLITPPEALAEVFGLGAATPSVPPDLPPRFNIAPTQAVPAIRAADSGSRRFDLLHWGLVPSWADDPSIGNRLINARAESIAAKPAFRHAARSQRCLVPADGFYEWRKPANKGGRKQPYLLRMRDRRPFAFAGLWERWRPKDGTHTGDRSDGTKGTAGTTSPLESCTIITTVPNDLVRPIHDRMPVILHQADYDAWLDPEQHDPAALLPLLRPFDAAAMEAVPVSTYVNKPQHDSPRCVEPVEASGDKAPEPGGLFG